MLRRFGWRYSVNRDAWVLRFANGRWGPVYAQVESDDSDGWHHDELLYGSTTPEQAPTVLPSRKPVSVRLTNDDDVREVHVDGRPPLPKRTVTEPINRSRSAAS